MKSIQEYAELIDKIPLKHQSTLIKKDVWQKFSYASKKKIENKIFGKEDRVEISRNDILEEKDFRQKIVKILMWGYPTGGRGNNIENVLQKLDKLNTIFQENNNKDLSKAEAEQLIKKFEGINGLGASTWSKFLFFFNVSIESLKCQIFDLKIVDSLNKPQFTEFKRDREWKQTKKDFFEYIKLLDTVSKKM